MTEVLRRYAVTGEFCNWYIVRYAKYCGFLCIKT